MTERLVRCLECNGLHDAVRTRCPVTGRVFSLAGIAATHDDLPVHDERNTMPSPAGLDGYEAELAGLSASTPRTEVTSLGALAAAAGSPIHDEPGPTGAALDARALSSAPGVSPGGSLLPITLGASGTQRAAGSFAGVVLDGRYRVDRRIGEGGMGVVYAGEHLELRKPVAIKILAQRYVDDPVTTSRFHREARVAGGLGHPNVVEVLDLATLDDGRPYLVMELLEGETLGRRVRREKGLGVSDTVCVLRQLLSALQATHARGVIHRDLNPENVFLCAVPAGAEPRVKVLDFGISKQQPTDEHDTLSSLTRAGMVLGTPGYMAPEQLGGYAGVDARADLYAVGALAFESLTGRPPFHAHKLYDLMVAMQRPPSPRALVPEVSEGLDAFVRSMLASLPDERPGTAAVALAMLEAAMRVERRAPA